MTPSNRCQGITPDLFRHPIGQSTSDPQSKKRNQLTRQKSLGSSPPRSKPSGCKPIDLQQSSSGKTTAKQSHHSHADTSPKRKKAGSNGHSSAEQSAMKGSHGTEQIASGKGGHVKVHQTSSGSPKQKKKEAQEMVEMTGSKIGHAHRHKDDVMMRSKR